MEGMVEMSLHISMQIGYKRTARQEKMVEKREEQTQQTSSSGVAVNEHDIVLKVLGVRRGTPTRSWTGSEGHFLLSLIHYDIVGPTQYQSIYSGNQCIEVQNGDIHASNE
ncbi:Uncharacterized protein Fot_24780 [Forsythia ovata]|uniref:Uncharacterized protein n=1 Tax=Forsythia ovata TaxID=205694 RepID=A0ABD1U775_9LAMI